MKRAAVVGILLLAGQLGAQRSGVTLSAYEIIERVDKQLRYLEGLNKLQLTITSNKGAVRVFKGTLFQRRDSSFFIFDTLGRGRILKILYNDQGQNIYAYNMLDKRLFHKREQDRFDAVLHSGFYFIDLNNSPLLDNYTPKISGREKQGKKSLLRIESIPLDKGKYSKLNVLVDSQNDFLVKRIDFFDPAGVLLKSLVITFDKLPVRVSRKKEKSQSFPVKMEMMDMSRGTISTLEFMLNDRTAKLDPSLFKKENIEK